MTASTVLTQLRASVSRAPVVLDVGIGGGGREFASWLGSALALGSLLEVNRTDAGLESTFEYGQIVDAGARPPARRFEREIGRMRVIPPDGSDFTAQAETPAHEIVGSFLHHQLEGSASAHFMTRFGGATSLADVADWRSVASAVDSGYSDRIERLARKSDSFQEHFGEMQRRGGTRLLDLGRVLYLLRPDPMHLGDEWASLASANSHRTYSLADINRVLSDFREYFNVDLASEVSTAEAVNPFVRTLFSGFVPSSSSEYVEMFRWMSDRAVASLTRSDSSDSFIREALPLVAARGGCLPALLEDGAVMLASDVGRLTEHLESDPSLMVSRGAKAILLHAHRLQHSRGDREAQMELALRRMDLMAEADRIAEALPGRAWRPVWSSTSPTNVHRILSEDTAGVLAIAASPGDHPFRAYAALGNGQLRQVRRASSTLLDTGSERGEAEIRGLAVMELDGTDLIVAAASDATITAYRVSDPDGEMLVEQIWRRQEPLASPLTTAVLWTGSDGGTPVVLSGGVSGTVWRNDVLTGKDLGPLVEWGAEIRSVRVLVVQGRAHAAVAAVDGRVALIDLGNGTEVAGTTVTERMVGDRSGLLTPSCMDAIEADGEVHILVGFATGEVFTAVWAPENNLLFEELVLPGVPPSGVNEVALRIGSTGSIERYIARNDGVWLRCDAQADRRIKAFVGHAGPILSQAVASIPLTGEVLSLTGGAEGTVRIWRHVSQVDEALSYLRVNRHRGAIRAVAMRQTDAGLQLVTGGDDGDVRAWNGSDSIRGLVISQHQGRVTRFLWLTTTAGMRLVVAASDGTLRLASPDEAHQSARLLGIAHEGVTALAAGTMDGIFWSAGNDGGVTRWDAAAGLARTSRIVCRYGGVTSMVADDQGHLFVGGQDGSLALVDADNLDVLSSRSFDSAVTALEILPELALVVVGLADGSVLTIDVTRGLRSRPRALFSHGLTCVAVKVVDLHGSMAIATAGRDRNLVVIDAESRAILHQIGLEGFPAALASRDRYIAVGTTAGVTLFEFADGRFHNVRR